MPRQRSHSSGLSPAGLLTTFYCLTFETSTTRGSSPRIYISQEQSGLVVTPDTWCPNCVTSRHSCITPPERQHLTSPMLDVGALPLTPAFCWQLATKVAYSSRFSHTDSIPNQHWAAGIYDGGTRWFLFMRSVFLRLLPQIQESDILQ
jgi:hypothetical protein